MSIKGYPTPSSYASSMAACQADSLNLSPGGFAYYNSSIPYQKYFGLHPELACVDGRYNIENWISTMDDDRGKDTNGREFCMANHQIQNVIGSACCNKFEMLKYEYMNCYQKFLNYKNWISQSIAYCKSILARFQKNQNETLIELDCSECEKPARDNRSYCASLCPPSAFPDIDFFPRPQDPNRQSFDAFTQQAQYCYSKQIEVSSYLGFCKWTVNELRGLFDKHESKNKQLEQQAFHSKTTANTTDLHQQLQQPIQT